MGTHLMDIYFQIVKGFTCVHAKNFIAGVIFIMTAWHHFVCRSGIR